mmetsp:Transcript_131/g.286  ORF Transcript_131/g.286 Transcript_131/m.286 type:complete len:272 (+) Transcript_131:279-1094(+)|eukprot:CAMPEP_0206575550 /NCGR_PEP_ID=MMETSP0325_2-20121206/30149_1 /ASSEMBLY_ACC=CAM_ASM_000347 /TAXON_ID=2866 /ORGANISM="Crypthecodinium cohnii, Strain Seligo" /LENGTH=271 /DNA_ID=CAMNT_0054080449 /DNA_START=226 /DNA_END=1041 /DNA_ORIENTATION=+
MALGIIVRPPDGGKSRWVDLPEELPLCTDHGLVLEAVEERISETFGWEDVEDDEDMRLLHRGSDLDSNEAKSMLSFLEAVSSGAPCYVSVLLRLAGGKGGFGALLRKQGRGKKTTNFDAMRDLSGRRLRHSKAVDRIKEWLESKKKEDELVKMLTGEGPELPKPTAEQDSLDPEYIEKLKRNAASMPSLVRRSIEQLEAEAQEPPAKRAKQQEKESADSKYSTFAGGALDALSMLSSDSEGEGGESENEGEGGGEAAQASAAASSSTASSK